MTDPRSIPPPRPLASAALRRLAPRLWSHRLILWPTVAGWMLLGGLALAGAAGWWLRGEDFLAVTDRPGEDVLVVEGWIGNSGVRAAADEFRTGHYHRVVATGNLTSDRWDTQQWSYAEMARRDLLTAGTPRAAIILAIPRETGEQRTFESALAARAALSVRPDPVHFITVFTLGAHARRSRAIFAKVFGPDVGVGVIAWRPAGERGRPWWRSSERADDFVKESAGWLAEVLFNSGRGFGSFAFPRH